MQLISITHVNINDHLCVAMDDEYACFISEWRAYLCKINIWRFWVTII